MNQLMMIIALMIFSSFFNKVNGQINFDSVAISKSSEYRTLFQGNNQRPKISGFTAITMDFGVAPEPISLNIGGELAALINRSFYIGFYGKNLVTFPAYSFTYYDTASKANEATDSRGIFFHGGLLVGGVIFPKAPIHLGLSTKIGGGGFLLYKENYEFNNYEGEIQYQSWMMSPIFVVSPQLDLEMNLTNWFKFKVGLGYQWVSSSNLTYNVMEAGNIVEKRLLNSNILQTPYCSMSLVFGWFK